MGRLAALRQGSVVRGEFWAFWTGAYFNVITDQSFMSNCIVTQGFHANFQKFSFVLVLVPVNTLFIFGSMVFCIAISRHSEVVGTAPNWILKYNMFWLEW